MCEYTVRLNGVLNRMGSQTVEDYFPAHVRRSLSLDRDLKGCCPYCGREMLPDELRPPGRTTRSICPQCYDRLIDVVPVEKCIICRGQLPHAKTQSQQVNRREIAHYMHENSCRDYFTLIHSAVVGEALTKKTQQLPPTEILDLQEFERNRGRLLDQIQSSLKAIQMTALQLSQPVAGLLPATDSGLKKVPAFFDREVSAKDDMITIDLPLKKIKTKP